MPGRFDLLQQTFLAWLALDPAERAVRLTDLVEEDPTLAAELRRLFAADARPTAIDRSDQLLVEALVPERLGRFRVLRELGRGGMGVVYEAEQELPRRRVALKMASRPELDPLFHHEVQAMVELLHPGIPQVYELFQADGRTVAAMELVEGEPLLDAVGRRFLGRVDRVGLLIGIVDAVAHAHARGVVHRDIKPANVLVTTAGSPKLIDFGIATFADLPGPAGAGTLAYVAPEQLAGEPADARVDVYALGVLGWRLLIGEEPIRLEGLDRAGVLHAKQQASPVARGLPPDLAAILGRAVRPHPGDRYADAGAMAEDLRSQLAGRPVRALDDAPLVQARAWVAAHRRALVGMGLGALAIVLLVVGGTSRIRARRAAADALALAAIQAHPDTSRAAFEALVRSPSTVPRVVSEAWAWRARTADPSEAPTAWATAYSTAIDVDAEQLALAGLARSLVALDRWDDVAVVVGALPGPVPEDIQMAGALARWATREVEDTIGADRRPILAALGRARRLPPASPAASLMPDGGAVLAEGARLHRIGPDGATTTLSLPAEPDHVALDGQQLLVRSNAQRGITAVDLPTFTAHHVWDTAAPLGPYTRAAGELYVVQSYPERSLRRVRSGRDEGVSPDLDAANVDVDGLAAADLDGDGVDELVLGTSGWERSGVWILTPDGKVRARLRARCGPLAVGGLGEAHPWVVVSLAAEGSRSGPVHLVRLGFDGELRVLDEHPLPQRPDRIRVTDLDGDGLDDVLAGYARGPRVATGVFRQLADGRLAEGVWLPGATLVDARAGRAWLTTEEASWIFGEPDAPALPVRPPRPVGTPEPVAARVPALARARWARIEGLAAWGLRSEAGDALAELAESVRGDVSQLARERAMALLAADPDRAGDVAARLADAGVATPAVSAALAAVHDLARLAIIGAPAGWEEPIATLRAVDGRLTFDHPLDRAWQVLRPEAVRRRPLGDGLGLRATVDRGDLVVLPMRWDAQALELKIDLDIVALDWAAGLEVRLEAEGWSRVITLARGGGGPASKHVLSALCGANWGPLPLPPTSVALRLSYVGGSTPSFGYEVGGLGAFVAPVAAAPPGELRLVLASHRHRGRESGLVDVVVRGVRVRGAEVPAMAERPLALAFADGDVAAVTTASTGADPLLATVARAELGEDARSGLAGLPDADLRFLLRVDPARWVGPAREVLGARFAEVFVAAWEPAIGYLEADTVVAQPAFSGLAVEGAADRVLALVRARGLLQAPGGAVEAERLLAVLREWVDAGDAWELTARLRLRAGDRVGAAEAVAAWLRSAASRAVAEDRIHDDPELAALAPPGMYIAPVWRAP